MNPKPQSLEIETEQEKIFRFEEVEKGVATALRILEERRTSWDEGDKERASELARLIQEIRDKIIRAKIKIQELQKP